MARSPQLSLLEKQKSPYGGELRKTRKGRAHGRPLDTQHTMHLVLRSTKAVGKWSFRYGSHLRRIKAIIQHFAGKYGIQLISVVNVGNHLHIHMRLRNRYTWGPFIRAITSAIAMAVTGTSRWQREEKAKGFWDYRPYTRVVVGRRAYLSLKDYIEMNKWEGFGFDRGTARTIVAVNKVGEAYWNSA